MLKLPQSMVVLTIAAACLAAAGCTSMRSEPPQTVSQWMDLEPVKPPSRD
jgi:hypothetical protein